MLCHSQLHKSLNMHLKKGAFSVSHIKNMPPGLPLLDLDSRLAVGACSGGALHGAEKLPTFLHG